MLGYTEKEFQELSFLDITHEDHREANWALVKELLEGKRKQFQIEKQYRRKNGSLVWVRNNVTSVPDSERAPRFLMALSEDITERKRAQEALRASERNARLIVDSIPGLVVRMSAAGEVEVANRQLLEYFGKRLEDIKNWTTSGVVHPEDLPRAIEIASNSFATGDPYEMEIRVRRFDGVYRWFQCRGLPLRDAEGRVLQWYALHTDIDDQKKVEERLRAIINTIPTAAWTTRPDGYYDFLNQVWLDYAGLTAEQAQGWGWVQAIHPDDRTKLVEEWQSSLASGTPVDTEG